MSKQCQNFQKSLELDNALFPSLYGLKNQVKHIDHLFSLSGYWLHIHIKGRSSYYLESLCFHHYKKILD